MIEENGVKINKKRYIVFHFKAFLQFFGTYDIDDDAVAVAGGQLPMAGGLLLGSMSTSTGTPVSVGTGRA